MPQEQQSNTKQDAWLRVSSQQPGVAFEDTFFPISRMTTLRILLAHAAVKRLVLRAADVAGAYLNASRDVEIYLEVQFGLGLDNSNANCLRLKQNLSSLKQSERVFRKALSELEFLKLKSERGLYIQAHPRSIPTYLIMDNFYAGHTIYQTRNEWCRTPHATAAASTMETEYVAVAEAIGDLIWLRVLMKEI